MRCSAALGALLLTAACGGSRAPSPEPEAAAFGTAHVGWVEFYDPAGTWMLLCQAREDTDRDGRIDAWRGVAWPEGDRLREWLVIEGGEGVDVGLVLAVDPARRFLLTEREGVLILHDTRRRSSTALREASTRAPKTHAEEPFAAFDAEGRRAVYGRVGRGVPAWARVRDLATGEETEVGPGPGAAFRPRLSANGRWVSFTIVDHDEDGDGDLAPWYRPATYFEGGCGRGATCVPGRGDPGLARIVEVGGTRRFHVPELLAFAADRWIVPRGGTVVLEGAEGRPEAIAAAADVLAVDERSQGLLYRLNGRTFFRDRTGDRDVGPDDAFRSIDVWEPVPMPWQERADHVFDAVSGRLLDGGFLAAAGKRCLAARGDATVVFDVRSGTERAVVLSLARRPYAPPPRDAGDFVALDGAVIDLAAGVQTGSYETDPERPESVVLGLRTDGALLRADGPRGGARFPIGPFRWKKADPPR